MHTRHRTASLIICLWSVALAAPASAETDPPSAEGMDRIKKTAEREARSSSSEGCAELYTELRSACADAVGRGLDVDCKRYIIAFEMGTKQAKGKLFDVGDAPPETNVRAANASCRVHLKSLRGERAKKDGAMEPVGATPADCASVQKVLDEQCLPALKEEGRLPPPCNQMMSVLASTRYSPSMKAQPRADTCKGALAVYEATRPKGQ